MSREQYWRPLAFNAASEEEHEHYSAMQSAGLFDELDRQDRLFRWRNWEELIEASGEVFQYIESEE